MGQGRQGADEAAGPGGGWRCAGGRWTLRQWIWGGLFVLTGAALVAPYVLFTLAWQLPLPLIASTALVAWLQRRRPADVLVLALPVAAASWLERNTAPELLACITLVLYTVTRRPRFSSVMAVMLLLLAFAGIEAKRRFAGTPLVWADLQFFFADFGGNLGVFASQPTLVAYASAGLVATAALAIVSWRWDSQAARQAAPRTRWIAPVLALGVSAWSAQALSAEAAALRGGHMMFLDSAQRPLARFLATTRMNPAWQPHVVDTGAFRKLVAQRQTGPAASPLADIVVFLQESQFNPRTIRGCPEALCGDPVFAPGPQTHAWGPLQVHVFGGGTWLSEFAAATGVPHTAFGRGGIYAPYNVAAGVHRSFVRSLRDAGYRTVAVYPITGQMMNARNAYAAYGFDRFYDPRELGLLGSYLTPDKSMHEAAMRVLAEERKHGKPVYLFVVTIFNHSQHGISLERVPPSILQFAHAAFPDPAEADNVADYVWRTREFGRTMAATRETLMRGDRPAVLAWFGDHQPAFALAPTLARRVMAAPEGRGRIPAHFQTWYGLWSNRTRAAGPPAAQPLDVAFLPGLLAEEAGVPLDDWLAANVVAREQCQGVFDACAQPAMREAYLSYLHDNLKAFAYP